MYTEMLDNHHKVQHEILSTLTQGVIDNKIKGLIVSGAPGCGKSYNVTSALEALEPKQAPDTEVFQFYFGPKFRIVKGHSSAAGLYQLLHEYSSEGDIIVLDDCDAIFSDPVALNLLKGALDTSDVRRLSWNTAGRQGSNVPKHFEFKGSIIFITNLDFKRDIAQNKPNAVHLAALMNRCYYFDMGGRDIDTQLLVINDVISRNPEAFGTTPRLWVEIYDFMRSNAYSINGLSIRRAKQIIDMVNMTPHWKIMVMQTLMK